MLENLYNWAISSEASVKADERSTTTMSSLKSRKEAISIDEVRELAKSMSGRKLAAQYGIPAKTFSRWLLEWGIKSNDGAKLPAREVLAEMYLRGMTTTAIAEQFGATSSNVASKLRSHGVQMRASGQNLGKKMPKSASEKLSAFRRGNFLGEANPNWRGGKPAKWQKERCSYLSKEWSKAVRSRDNHTCQHCGISEVKLHAHHVKPWKHHPELRYEVSNGLTLCSPCHQAVHKFQFPWLNGESGTSAEHPRG